MIYLPFFVTIMSSPRKVVSASSIPSESFSKIYISLEAKNKSPNTPVDLTSYSMNFLMLEDSLGATASAARVCKSILRCF